MSGGKSRESASKDYFGHAAGRICQGQLDFVWGLMINNELVWPTARRWDSQIYQSGTITIYSDGNAYKTNSATLVDPPSSPWFVLATPYAGGTHYKDDTVIHNGNVWKAAYTTSLAPQTNAPPNTTEARAIAYNGWFFVCTPKVWTSVQFWPANSIVASKGRLYTTPVATSAEPPNGPWVLWKVDRANTTNPFKFTVPDYGDAFIYWGTANQTLSASEGVLAARGHPAYRHRATLVLKNFRFGTGQVNAPDVQILGGRIPQQSLVTGAAAEMDADWNVNPWCVAAEFLTHPVIGLGMPRSWFDQPSWQAQADFCAANPQLYYISPLYNSLQKVRQIISDLMGYPDAFIFWNTVAQLVAGHWPHGEAAPAFTAATTIDRNDIVTELVSSSDGWDGTRNSVVVSFDDIRAAFKSRPVIAPNLFNMNATRRLQSQRVERPHIVRFNQALAWATEMAKVAGDQVSGGTLSVRAEKADAIQPGSLFLLTDDEFQISEVQRCTRKVKSAPPAGVVKLTHQTENGVAPQPYSPTQPDPAEPQGPAPSAITNASFVLLPTALAGESNTIACLAGRSSDLTTSFELWFKYADGAAYQQLATQRSFSVNGRIGKNAGQQHQTDTFENVDIGVPGNSGSVALSKPNAQQPTLVQYQRDGVWHDAVPGTDYHFSAFNYVWFPTGTSVANGDTVLVDYLWQAQLAPAPVTYIPMYQLEGGISVFVIGGHDYQLPDTSIFGLTCSCFHGGVQTTGVEGVDYTVDYQAGVWTPTVGGIFDGADHSTTYVTYSTGLLVYIDPLTPASDIESISDPLTEDEVNDQRLLLFGFQAGDHSRFEIISIKSLTALGDGYYVATVRRAQYGTAHGGDGVYEFVDDPMSITLRRSLAPISNAVFPSLQSFGSQASFVLAPASVWVQADIGDLYDPASNPGGLATLFDFTFYNIYAPTISLTSIALQTGAVITDFSQTNILTTDVLTALFEAGDLNNDLNDVSITAYLGTAQVSLLSTALPRSGRQTLQAQFSLPTPGAWDIVATVSDASGNTAKTTLCTLHVKTATYPLPPPRLWKYDQRKLFAANVTFLTPNTFGGAPTTGLALKYQLVARGQAYNNANWLNVTGTPPGAPSGFTAYGPIPNFNRFQKTLWAKSSKAGSNDSVVVSFNF